MARWYGSVDNRLEENRMLVSEIKVGTGMTEYSWSDRHPYEVVAVKDQKHVSVRRMSHKASDNGKPKKMGHQDWDIKSDPSAPILNLAKRGNYWYEVHKYTDDDGKARTAYYRKNVTFGKAEYYYDCEF